MTTRQRLVETTKQLLSRQGFEATSPRQIQQASGVGQGSFYHHFDSKAALASAALESLAEDMRAELDAHETSAGLVDGFLRAERDALAGCRIGRLAMESAIEDQRLRTPVAAYFDHLRQRLTDEFEAGEWGIPAAQLADLVVAAVQGGYVLARVTGDPTAQRQALDALAALLAPRRPSPQET